MPRHDLLVRLCVVLAEGKEGPNIDCRRDSGCGEIGRGRIEGRAGGESGKAAVQFGPADAMKYPRLVGT